MGNPFSSDKKENNDVSKQTTRNRGSATAEACSSHTSRQPHHIENQPKSQPEVDTRQRQPVSETSHQTTDANRRSGIARRDRDRDSLLLQVPEQRPVYFKTNNEQDVRPKDKTCTHARSVLMQYHSVSEKQKCEQKVETKKLKAETKAAPGAVRNEKHKASSLVSSTSKSEAEIRKAERDKRVVDWLHAAQNHSQIINVRNVQTEQANVAPEQETQLQPARHRIEPERLRTPAYANGHGRINVHTHSHAAVRCPLGLACETDGSTNNATSRQTVRPKDKPLRVKGTDETTHQLARHRMGPERYESPPDAYDYSRRDAERHHLERLALETRDGTNNATSRPEQAVGPKDEASCQLERIDETAHRRYSYGDGNRRVQFQTNALPELASREHHNRGSLASITRRLVDKPQTLERDVYLQQAKTNYLNNTALEHEAVLHATETERKRCSAIPKEDLSYPVEDRHGVQANEGTASVIDAPTPPVKKPWGAVWIIHETKSTKIGLAKPENTTDNGKLAEQDLVKEIETCKLKTEKCENEYAAHANQNSCALSKEFTGLHCDRESSEQALPNGESTNMSEQNSDILEEAKRLPGLREKQCDVDELDQSEDEVFVLSPVIEAKINPRVPVKPHKECFPGETATKHPGRRRGKKNKRLSSDSDSGASEKHGKDVSLTFQQGICQADLKCFIEYVTGSDRCRLTSLDRSQKEDDKSVVKTFTLKCNSGKKAREFVKLVAKKRGTMEVEARVIERMEQDDFLQLQCQATDRKIQQSLQRHQNKILETEAVIKATKNHKNMSPEEFGTAFDKLKAMDEKLKELQRQKKEFVKFTEDCKERLMKLSPGGRIKDDAAAIRREVGLEIAKLSTALPIYARKSEIVDTVDSNQVCVVLGETGSGKSTQLVQYMHTAGYGDRGMIVCTQPRKVAATSLAKHVAREMGSHVGGLVGYQLGNVKTSNTSSKILFMTDHTLLNECIKDPLLKKYSCVIIDEAHERSIYTDLLIGMVKRCLRIRPELKLIITSATIDPEVFIKYFGGCPLVRVSGRMFPVEVIYSKGKGSQKSYLEDAVSMALKVHREEPDGDVLVFLTSLADIEKACSMTTGRNNAHNGQVLPLHGQLPPAEQQLVFEPAKQGKRKIIFATNVAETSLTIPGIKYVIDTGFAKEKIYDGQRNRSSLEVRFISKSSANQRKGRAGRTESGKCYRLFSEDQYEDMDIVSTPEIFRVHLGQALMKLMELGVSDALSFEFVQAPPKEAFATAMTQLEKLGACKDGQLTPLGKKMAKFPLEPRLSRFVLKAIDLGISFTGLVVAALCTVAGSIFFRAGTDEQKSQADKLKVRFCDPGGDILTMLFAFEEWNSVTEKGKGKWCMENSFNFKSMRIVRDTVKELKGILCDDLGINVHYKFEEEGIIRKIVPKLLLGCFCDSLAFFSGYEHAGYFLCEKDVVPTTPSVVKIHPSSSFRFLAKNSQWVVYSQLLTTSEAFILNVTSVEEEWVQELVSQGTLDFDMNVIQDLLLQGEITGRIGRQTGLRLGGKRLFKLRELQDEIREEAEKSLVFLDLNLDIGRLQMIGANAYTEGVLDILKERVDAEKETLSNNVTEQSLVNDSGVRLVLGSGAEIKHILMPSEFRCIMLSNVPDGTNKDDIQQYCSAFGTVVDCFQFMNTSDRHATNNKWGKVTFADPESARLATEVDQLPFQTQPVLNSQQKHLTNNLDAKVEWCRRAPTGIAFVSFVDEIVAQNARAVIYRLRLCGSVVVVKPGKNGDDIFLRGVPPEVTQELIKEALIEQYDWVDIKKVTILRKRELTMPDEVKSLQKQLTQKIKQYYDGEFTARVTQPRENDPYFRSYISLFDVIEGMQLIEGLNMKMMIRNQLVRITPIIKTKLSVRKEICDVTEGQLSETIETLENDGDVKVTRRWRKYDDLMLEVASDDMEEAAYAIAELRKVVRGLPVDISSTKDFSQLCQTRATRWLQSLQKQTNTFIELDRRQSQVLIYGEDRQQRQAELQLMEYLQRECANNETRKISLKGDDLPMGMMKELFKRYGINLKELQANTEAAYMEVDVRRHLLHVSGKLESIERVKQEITKIQESIEQGIDAHNETDKACLGDCSVCLCPVSTNDCYILECCGHPNCKSCIVHLIDNAVQNRDFPISCPAEGCEQPFFICDVKEVLEQSSKTWQELQMASLDSFMREHPREYKYCITPNCSMVYRSSRNGKAFSCSVCSVNICTSCHSEYHHGITCEVFQLSQRREETTKELKKWLRGDRANRSLCPTCATPIWKDGGCQKVQCKICKAKICWGCKKVFSSDQDVYRHLMEAHGDMY